MRYWIRSADAIHQPDRESQNHLAGSRKEASEHTAKAVTDGTDSPPQTGLPFDEMDRAIFSEKADQSLHKSGRKKPSQRGLVASLEPEMLLIPAGEFLLGSEPQRDEHARDDEQPQASLHLSDYWLARTPVTNDQYVSFVAATERRGWQQPSGKDKHPAVNVSWHDARAYCRWLAQVTGKFYRLPTETEWEKGARGTDGRIWPWGDQWVLCGCNTSEERKGDTMPVDTYAESPSPYGLLDMVGNVGEWTRTKWGPDPAAPRYGYPYRSDDGREDPASDDHRVVRGGCWFNSGWLARRIGRFGGQPSDRFGNLGFRVAVSPIQF